VVWLRVFVGDGEKLAPESERALRHAEAAARRFPGLVTLEALALDAPPARERGIAIAPTVMVDDLVVAVGQAPPAGHLLRAIEAALGREGADERG